jgi:tight adherence protein C
MANQAVGAGAATAFPGRPALSPRERKRRRSIFGGRVAGRTEARLARAGSQLTPAAFYMIVLLSTVALPSAGYLGLGVGLGASSIVLIIALPVLALIGAYLPYLWLRSAVASRQTELRRLLPDVLDLLTLCVESGLGLDAAFRRVTEETTGSLANEISQMLHEVDLGKPRREALEDLAARVQLQEVDVVVNSMIQSQQMGTSLSQTLRSQTRLMRLRRRQRAEQMARQASVKMAFPLVLFLMPSLFIVVLGPIAINIFKVLND